MALCLPGDDTMLYRCKASLSREALSSAYAGCTACDLGNKCRARHLIIMEFRIVYAILFVM